MKTAFPTRQVMRRYRAPRPVGAEALEALAEPAPESNLYRLVAGLDAARTPMSLADAQALGDLFSRKLLLQGANPLTLRALVAAIAAIADPPLPLRRMFLVAEGAQFVAAGPGARRLLRSAPLEIAGDDEVEVEIRLRGPAGDARLTATLSSLAEFNLGFALDWRPGPADTYGGWHLP